MACIGKNMYGNFTLGSISLSIGKAFKPLNHIWIPSVTLFCTYNSYLHSLRWVLQKRPIWHFPASNVLLQVIKWNNKIEITFSSSVCESNCRQWKIRDLPVRIEHLNSTIKIKSPCLTFSRFLEVGANPFWQWFGESKLHHVIHKPPEANIMTLIRIRTNSTRHSRYFYYAKISRLTYIENFQHHKRLLKKKKWWQATIPSKICIWTILAVNNWINNTTGQTMQRIMHHYKEKGCYFRDGIDEGKLCKVCRTFSTSPSLFSVFTFPGTESNTHSCSASENKI